MRAIILTFGLLVSLSSISQSDWKDSYKWIEVDTEDLELFGKDYLSHPTNGNHEKTRERRADSSILYVQNSIIDMYDALPGIKEALNNIKSDLVDFGYTGSISLLAERVHHLQLETAERLGMDKNVFIRLNDIKTCNFIVNQRSFIIVMREYVD